MGTIFFKNKKEKILSPATEFFNLSAVDIDGNQVQLSEFKNRKAIIVVSYTQLEEIYKKNKDKGLEILGFPCNQFMSQEPAPNQEIKEHVTKTYGVTFRLFSKIDVNGDKAHPLFKFLRLNSELSQKEGEAVEIPWNFAKFLINPQGKVVGYYNPKQYPETMIPAIEKLLSA